MAELCGTVGSECPSWDIILKELKTIYTMGNKLMELVTPRPDRG
jgi:hypothetical protein